MSCVNADRYRYRYRNSYCLHTGLIMVGLQVVCVVVVAPGAGSLPYSLHLPPVALVWAVPLLNDLSPSCLAAHFCDSAVILFAHGQYNLPYRCMPRTISQTSMRR